MPLQPQASGISHVAIVALACVPPLLSAQDWSRADITFEQIEARAKALAGAAYQPPSRVELPAWAANLTYDQYRGIRFPDRNALWQEEGLNFRAMFYHPGYLFKDSIGIHEFTDSHSQAVRLSTALFDYGENVPRGEDLPPDGGFSGFRLNAALNDPNRFDELIVFQGASYWRALGAGQRYGLSARGLALNSAEAGVPEEFPVFREFWLRKPKPGENHARFFALLDSPSASGAYAFIVEPGTTTSVIVRAVLFPRHEVERVGIAPMSSMYWFGENSRRRFDDFRPEVHDSDGLSLITGMGERIWRPAQNDTGGIESSYFKMERCAGFGLLQRDRDFTSYIDGEANYEMRPSLWIEPTSDWGPGSVVLKELPTANELADNLVAFWQPAEPFLPGERREFSYRQQWTVAPNPAQAGAWVVATRTGVHDWMPEQRLMIVEFAGPSLDVLDAAPEAVIEILGDGRERAEIASATVAEMPDGRWRLAFVIKPRVEELKLAEIGPLELRASLKKDADFLTETWSYRVKP